jgi:hypothetical protein
VAHPTKKPSGYLSEGFLVRYVNSDAQRVCPFLAATYLVGVSEPRHFREYSRNARVTSRTSVLTQPSLESTRTMLSKMSLSLI